MGRSTKRIFSIWGGTLTTTYNRGSMVYNQDGTMHLVIPKGVVRYINGTWLRQYHLTDYLGNTRAVVSEAGEILQQTDYYPFGTAYALDNTDKNKYLYGGKELQDEAVAGAYPGVLLNLYDFGARYLDGQYLPIWTSIDPLTEKYYSVSPYAYALNNPVNLVDPTGMTPEEGEYDEERDLYFSNAYGWVVKDFYTYLTQEEGGYALLHQSGDKGLVADTYLRLTQPQEEASEESSDGPNYVTIKISDPIRDAAYKIAGGLSQVMPYIPIVGSIYSYSSGQLSGESVSALALFSGLILDGIPGGGTVKGGQLIKEVASHAVHQAVTRGFKSADILKIIREGVPVQAMGRFGSQTRYSLGGNTVIVNAQGKIVSVYSNAPGTRNSLGKGNFIPFK